MYAAFDTIGNVEFKFEQFFGRRYEGPIEEYGLDDAEYVIVTLGSVAGLVRSVVDELRARGEKVAMLRIRYMRPFPAGFIEHYLSRCEAFAVLEKDVSFGFEGTVFTNVKSVLFDYGWEKPALNYIGGLGGEDITREDIVEIFAELKRTVETHEIQPFNWLGAASDKNWYR